MAVSVKELNTYEGASADIILFVDGPFFWLKKFKSAVKLLKLLLNIEVNSNG